MTHVDGFSESVRFNFDNTYARLPERFYARVAPTPVAQPNLVKWNETLGALLGLDSLEHASAAGVAVFAGNTVAAGSEPLAAAYAGHQFGHFVPRLGDGRANLLGEVIGRDGVRYDIQLKGAGRTPFSRGGDGRAALGPVLREYLISEAMAALGVPTTRALAVVMTGETVFRETAVPGAVLTRVAKSHLRVGTFQYFAAQGDVAGVRALAEYAMARHYPEAVPAAKPFGAFLEGVIRRQARLVAQWMLIGFIHGVMNTDNTSISGDTLDYGPCAFLEAYDPNAVFSAIDRMGRYAYSNQPGAMHWNLARLAEALLPLLVEEEGSDEAGLACAYAALERFATEFDGAWLAGMRAKLGLVLELDGDRALGEDLLRRMAENGADFTLTFRRLSDAGSGNVRELFQEPAAYDAWKTLWSARLAKESASGEERAARMRAVNPAFIPRNHLVEAALRAGIDREDFQPFEKLLEVLAKPYEDRAGSERYAAAALAEELVTQTFCGT